MAGQHGDMSARGSLGVIERHQQHATVGHDTDTIDIPSETF